MGFTAVMLLVVVMLMVLLPVIGNKNLRQVLLPSFLGIDAEVQIEIRRGCFMFNEEIYRIHIFESCSFCHFRYTSLENVFFFHQIYIIISLVIF